MIRLQHPTVHVPPWPLFDDPAAASDSDESAAADAYSCDEFRMYEFKVRRCARGRSHDWTECPYAHPGEKARRRDPRRFHYSGAACPEFRKGSCKRGDSCEFAHGVFECWLHPARYRTQPCKDGIGCRRRVCFFAHTPDQLRVVPPASQQSPRAAAAAAAALEAYFASGNVNNNCGAVFMLSSPTSTLASPPMSPTSESPPMSPVGMGMGMGLWRGASSPVNEVLASLRKLQISKARGLYSLPATPSAGGAAARRRGEEEDEGADPDLDWVSELVE